MVGLPPDSHLASAAQLRESASPPAVTGVPVDGRGGRRSLHDGRARLGADAQDLVDRRLGDGVGDGDAGGLDAVDRGDALDEGADAGDTGGQRALLVGVAGGVLLRGRRERDLVRRRDVLHDDAVDDDLDAAGGALHHGHAVERARA